jgi:predicted XRE-type DNA-binding protein
MASEFHKRAISRITPEERALMVKSLEIISQIHAILDRRDINQKELAELLKVSPPAISKMLTPGGNLEMNTVVKLELLLGETIITTPQKMEEDYAEYVELPIGSQWSASCLSIAYSEAEETGMKVAI